MNQQWSGGCHVGRGRRQSHAKRDVFSPAQIGKALGAPFNVADFHNYKYTVTENGEKDTVVFFIDGVKFDGVKLPLKDSTISFGDETDRRISFINANDAGTDIVYDNLTLTTLE